MKKLMRILGATIFASFFLMSCGSGPSTEEKAKIIKDYKDSIALAEKAKQDSINSLIPDIKVNIYVRTEVLSDSEGWPVEMGKVVLVKDFQEKKEYQLKDYDYIEKIEIVGQSNDMTLQFINGKSNKIVHEEKTISLNGIKTYTTSDPIGNKHKYYQEWLNTTFDGLIIKILYKDNSIFEGKINPFKQLIKNQFVGDWYDGDNCSISITELIDENINISYHSGPCQGDLKGVKDKFNLNYELIHEYSECNYRGFNNDHILGKKIGYATIINGQLVLDLAIGDDLLREGRQVFNRDDY